MPHCVCMLLLNEEEVGFKTSFGDIFSIPCDVFECKDVHKEVEVFK